MTVWFDGVDITVEVAFLTAPLAETPIWTDITDYVRSVDTDAGRSNEYTAYSPRRLSLTLSNNDRRFDPEYLDGAYVGNPLLAEDGTPLLTEGGGWLRPEGDTDDIRLLPMKRVRVWATYDATTYPIFDGFVLGWPQFVRGFYDETVRVDAVDGSRFLEQSTLAASAYHAAVLADSPLHYWPLQEQNTSMSSDFSDVVGGLNASPYSGFSAPNSAQTDTPVGSVLLAPNTLNDFGDARSLVTRSDFVDFAPKGLECWFKMTDTNRQFTVAVALSARTLIRLTTSSVFTPGILIDCDYSNEADNLELGNHAVTGSINRDLAPFGLYHAAVMVTGPTTLSLYVNGQLATTYTLTSGTLLSTSLRSIYISLTGDTEMSGIDLGGVSHVAVYDDALSAERIEAHYVAGLTAFGHPFGERGGARIGRVLDEIGWPAALRELSTGDTVHGQYLPAQQSALEYLRQVAAGDDGLLFIAADGKVTFRSRSWQWAQASSGTFSDDGEATALTYSDIVVDANSVDPIRNKVAVSFRSTDGYVRVEDATSITNYGPSSETVSASTVDSASTARALAGYRLRTRKDPRTLITELEAKPRSNPAVMFPALLGLDIGDVVAVERTPARLGAQVVKSLAVQGVAHSIGSNGEWVTRLYLAPAPTSGADAPYLLVNTSGAQSLIGAASGNLIPF